MIRRISSREKEERKRKRNQFILGGFLILIMFFSVIAYAVMGLVNFGSNSENLETINYNGFEFQNQNGFWLLEKDGKNFIFRNNPNSVEKINNEIKPAGDYAGKTLYVYSENVLAESEIRANLFYFADNIEVSEFKDNCENNFIVIRESMEKRVLRKNNCIFIEGKKEDLISMTDSFLFKLLEIQ